jgi:hypothetical protein
MPDPDHGFNLGSQENPSSQPVDGVLTPFTGSSRDRKEFWCAFLEHRRAMVAARREHRMAKRQERKERRQVRRAEREQEREKRRQLQKPREIEE